MFETAAPSSLSFSESAVGHPGRCLKCKCTDSILVSTKARALWDTRQATWAQVNDGWTCSTVTGENLDYQTDPLRRELSKKPHFQQSFQSCIKLSTCAPGSLKNSNLIPAKSWLLLDTFPTLCGRHFLLCGGGVTPPILPSPEE